MAKMPDRRRIPKALKYGLLWPLGVLFGLYIINGMIGTVRHAYYSINVAFEVDGETITAWRMVECTRRPFVLFGVEMGVPEMRAGSYSAEATALGVPLSDGSALIVRTLPNCNINRPRSRPREPLYPSVYWIDDAEEPTRAEAYLHPVYFDRPDARVKMTRYEIEPEGVSPISLEWFLPWYWYDIRNDVPWTKGPNGSFAGYYFMVAEEKDWSWVPGLSELFSQFEEPVILPTLTNEQRQSLRRDPDGPFPLTQYLFPLADPRSGCSRVGPYTRDHCRQAHENSYTLKVLAADRLQLLLNDAMRWPYAELALLAAGRGPRSVRYQLPSGDISTQAVGNEHSVFGRLQAAFLYEPAPRRILRPVYHSLSANQLVGR